MILSDVASDAPLPTDSRLPAADARLIFSPAMDPAVALLRDLVAIDSVNPSLVPGAKGEQKAAEAVAAHMREMGLEVTLREVAPGRPNVIGVLDSGAPGRSLMFCGHIDTVGVEGMSAPFEPRIADGRLYGRGSQDMKGGVAAMIDAARVAATRGFQAGRLTIAVVVDEEYASIGADALVREWRADAAVVTEPTDLQIGVAHKGFAWLEVETRGRAAHGSRPADGRDAILAMGRVLAQLGELDRQLQARPPHPRLGTASLHASIIRGGRELSSYPDACRLEMERRTIPGEHEHAPEQELATILTHLRQADSGFEGSHRVSFARPPYAIEDDHPATLALEAAARIHDVPAPRAGLSFWTDAAVLGEAGIPSLLFGPGGAGLHSTEEYVVLRDVLACRDVLATMASTWCAGGPPG
jgi:acetylornithine deacetylase/succinyl-diaminopimelate desuccinylase family protein